MPLSSSDQQLVQDMIDSATRAQRGDFKVNAEMTLSRVNALMGTKLLSGQENKAGEIAIEMLVRLEATEQNKLFRTKRRLQLVQMYLGA